MTGVDEIQQLLERGLHYYGLGEIPQALSYWRRVLEHDPTNRTAAEYIEIATGQALPVSTAEIMLPPMPEQPPSFSAEFVDGQQRLFAGDWDRAVQAFEAANANDPDHPLYWPHVELARARLIKEVIDELDGSFPRLAVPVTQLLSRKDITQEDGFVLSLINGDLGLSDLVSLSPLPRYATYAILHRLLAEQLVEPGAAP